ncbi:hypothetical protein P4O66_014857 [Electrophorus voltai]|uniref:Epithelial stromal interaction 1 n=1 Tax=Electrophorus voltai TaxID=2609070 RepID=A0AAD9DQC5_9TELE|nr:hypothetical protein P4O66_014857 [Electrophorus voltai]
MNPDSSGTMTPHHHDDGADGNRADKPLQHTQPADQRQLTHIEGYSTVPPNESRRSRMLRIAQKELEDLDRWQDEHRPGPIHLAPEKLGGGVPLAEVRQKQQVDANRAKLQKKLKKEEMNKRARQEEEEKNQKMKAVQREKAWGHKHREGAEELAALQRKKDDQRRKGEILEEKQSQQEDTRERQMESERLRVNSLFLDRLEARGSGRASESPPRPVEGGNVWQAHRPQDPALSPGPDRAEEEEEEALPILSRTFEPAMMHVLLEPMYSPMRSPPPQRTGTLCCERGQECGCRQTHARNTGELTHLALPHYDWELSPPAHVNSAARGAQLGRLVCNAQGSHPERVTTRLFSLPPARLGLFTLPLGSEPQGGRKACFTLWHVVDEADHDWAVMRLQSQFPYYERELLEDIVSQCNGSYRQAYDLLSV